MTGTVGVIAASTGDAALSPFLEEQLLVAALGEDEADNPRELGAGRLRDLLGPVPRTGSVDTSDPGAAWFRAALAKDDNLALTNRGRYVATMTCAALVTEVLLAFTGSASASSINRCLFRAELAPVRSCTNASVILRPVKPHITLGPRGNHCNDTRA